MPCGGRLRTHCLSTRATRIAQSGCFNGCWLQIEDTNGQLKRPSIAAKTYSDLTLQARRPIVSCQCLYGPWGRLDCSNTKVWVGFSNDMPVGMQIIAGDFQEERLLNAAHQFQLQTDWHTRQPESIRGAVQ